MNNNNSSSFGSIPPSPASSNSSSMASSEQLVLELSNPELRENALLELSKVSSSSSQPFHFHLFLSNSKTISKFSISFFKYVIRVMDYD